MMKYRAALDNLISADHRYASLSKRDALVRDTSRIPRGSGVNPNVYEGTWDNGPPPLFEPGVGGITAKFPGFSSYGDKPKAGKPVYMPNDGPTNRWPTEKDYINPGLFQKD